MELNKRNPRMLFRVMVLAPLLMVTSSAEAQRGSVRGRVVDAEKQPLEGAEILLEYQGIPKQRIKAKTDDKGEFAQVGLPTGNYQLTYTMEGYVPVIRRVHVGPDLATDLGSVSLIKMPEGALTEKQHKEAQGYLDAAEEAMKKADYQGAIVSYEKFLQLSPKSAEAHYHIATAYDKMGKPDEAMKYYQKAVELRPDFFEAYLAISDVHASKQQWPEAMGALKKALELRPTEKTVLFNYGAYAGNTGDMATAQQAFEKFIELDPTNALARFQLALVLVGQEKNQEAIAHLEKYLELEPEGSKAETVKELLEQLKKN